MIGYNRNYCIAFIQSSSQSVAALITKNFKLSLILLYSPILKKWILQLTNKRNKYTYYSKIIVTNGKGEKLAEPKIETQ